MTPMSLYLNLASSRTMAAWPATTFLPVAEPGMCSAHSGMAGNNIGHGGQRGRPPDPLQVAGLATLYHCKKIVKPCWLCGSTFNEIKKNIKF